MYVDSGRNVLTLMLRVTHAVTFDGIDFSQNIGCTNFRSYMYVSGYF